MFDHEPTHAATPAAPHLGRSTGAPGWRARLPALIAASVFSLLALGITGCADGGDGTPRLPLTATEVAPLAADNLRALASAWRDGGAWLEDAPFASDMLGDLAGGFEDEPGGEPDEAGPLADALEGLADALEDDVLLADHLTSDDGATLVYAVPQSIACPTTDDPDAAACAFGDEPVAVRAYSYAEGTVVLGLLVGGQGVEVITITLAPDRLDVTVSLTALAPLMRQTGALDDADFTLEQLTGRVTASIAVEGAGRLAVTFGSDPIRVAGAEDGNAVAIEVGRTSVAAAIDGGAARVEASVNVGPIAIDVSGHDGERTRRLVADLPGVTANLDLDEAAQTLAVSGFSLGARTTTVKVDGQTVVAVDLTGAAGRSVDLELRRVGEQAQEIVVDRVLDLAVRVSAGALVGADAGWAANETLGVRIDGHATPTVRSHDDGTLEVVAGQVRYTSSARPDLGFTATAGQCVGEEEGAFEDDEAHPFEALGVFACE